MAEYGMLAKDNIEEGEVLFTIPRSALLHQGTSKLSALLDKGDRWNCEHVFPPACVAPLRL